MRTLYIAIFTVFLIGLSYKSYAQKPKEEDNRCVLILEDAEEYYRQGKIELIPSKLSDCLEGSRLSTEGKISAYRLLTLTYLYYNSRDTAEYYMKEMLRLDPEYEINENVDPSEFIQLYNTFKTTPVLLIGAKAGGNFAMVDVMDSYSLDPTNSTGTYSSTLGYQVNVALDIPITNRFSIAASPGYKYQKYEYTKTQFGYSSLEYSEDMSWVELPVFVRYYITKNKLSFFVQAGASLDYLLGANATLVRLDSINQELGNQTVAGPSQDIKDSRNSLNYNAIGGVGFTWKNVIGKGYLTAEINYAMGIDNIVDPEKRYSNTESLYSYLYIDNDIKLNSLFFSIGYYIPIYNPRLIDRKKRRAYKRK